jgi:hypothetical protein
MNNLHGRVIIKTNIVLDETGRRKDITLLSKHCTRSECSGIVDAFLAANPHLKMEIGAQFIHIDHIY